LVHRTAAKIQATSGQEQTLLDHPVIPVVLTGEVDVFWRAITSRNIVQLRISRINGHVGLPSGPVLSQFLLESPSLRILDFVGFHFEEEHWRALVALERMDLDLNVDAYLSPRMQRIPLLSGFATTKS
jgi:hypothetical protein